MYHIGLKCSWQKDFNVSPYFFTKPVVLALFNHGSKQGLSTISLPFQSHYMLARWCKISLSVTSLHLDRTMLQYVVFKIKYGSIQHLGLNFIFATGLHKAKYGQLIRFFFNVTPCPAALQYNVKMGKKPIFFHIDVQLYQHL